MQANNGALSFDAVITNGTFKAEMNEMKNLISGLGTTAIKSGGEVESAFKKLGTYAAGAFAFSELSQLPAKLISVRGEFQQLQLSLETMLGSKAKADKVFADVVQLAAKTPFSLQDVAGGAKSLLAYGFASQDVTKVLSRLGDVASGLNIPFSQLTELYGKTRVQGRLFAEDFNQFTGRGIPLTKLLADQFGVAEEKVRGMVEAGQVGFPEVEKAINKLTDAGGMFAGLTEKNSKTLTGLYSNFEDAVTQAFNKIGSEQEGLLAGSIELATTAVQNYEPLLDVLKVLVATYGAYKAAVIATAAVQALPGAVAAVNTFVDLAKSIRTAGDAQAFFNLVTKANPYVIAATALVALITAVALFSEKVTEAERAQHEFNATVEKAARTDTERKIKIDELKDSITNEALSLDERNKKLKELIALSPDHLKGLTLANIATIDGTAAIDKYVEAMKEKIRQDNINEQLAKNNARAQEIRSGKVDSDFSPSIFSKIGLMMAQGATQGQFDSQKEAKIATRKTRDQELKDLEDYNHKLLDESGRGIEDRRKQRREADKEVKSDAEKTADFYKKEIEKLESDQGNATNSKDFNALQKRIDALDEKRRAITVELTKEQEKYKKDADKVGPYGSLSYWDNIARKAQEIIDKTPGNNTAVLTAQNKIKLDAEKKAEDIRSQYTIKSFEDELATKKQQYELYQRWVDAYGKDASDKQFASLVAGNQSYLDYLNEEIKKLESKASITQLNKGDTGKLDLLNTERNTVTGKQTGIEVFNQSIQDAQDSSNSLIATLSRLKDIQAGLGDNPTTGDDYEKRRIVAEKILEIEKQRKDQLRSFLTEVIGSEQKRLEIETYYNDLLTELDKEHVDKTSDIYKKGKDDIEAAKKKELLDAKSRLFAESEEYKELEKVILQTGIKAIEQKIAVTTKAAAKAKKDLGEESEEYKKLLLQIRALNKDLSTEKTENLNRMVGLATELGDAFAQSNGALGEMGRALSTVGGGLTKVLSGLKTYNDNKSSGEGTGTGAYVAAAQGAIQLIGLAITSAKERKAVEQAYYASVIGQQKEYNRLINEQIGLNYKKSSNVFVTDEMGKINDGIKQLNDAQKRYEESLLALSDGQAKTGLRNKVDWGKVASGAVTGAAAGASLGPIGAAVGAVIGGVVGLFAGKKKKETFGPLLEVFPTLIDQAGNFNKTLAETLVANDLIDGSTKVLLQDTIAWADQIQAAKDQIKGVISDLAGSLGDSLRTSLVSAFEDGTDAAIAFGSAVGKVVEDVVSQIIFSRVFKQAFDGLEADLNASSDIDKGGDGNWVDDFGRFFALLPALAKTNEQMLQDAKDQAALVGIDIFNSKDATKSGIEAKATQGVVQGVSQDSVNMINGQMNAIRITQADSNQLIRSSLFELSGINQNTKELYAMRITLDSIETTLKTDFMRALGGN